MSEVAHEENLNTDTINKPGISKKKKFAKEARSIFLIILCVLAFRSTFFEPFKIPSGSMIPTLLIGDFILVNKFAYGFKVPFSDWFSDPTYITGPAQPKRGDVIVFKFPENPDVNYIKRVVAIPGDTVEVIDKVVYVNGSYIKTESMDGAKIMEDMDEKYKLMRFKFFKNKVGEHDFITQVDPDNIYQSDFYRVTVPQGKYFVMGDNRDYSYDSRSWGFVPFENIKGEAFMIWFSMSLPMPWDSDDTSFTFRPWRIGKEIP
jgi:signal peptidase I